MTVFPIYRSGTRAFCATEAHSGVPVEETLLRRVAHYNEVGRLFILAGVNETLEDGLVETTYEFRPAPEQVFAVIPDPVFPEPARTTHEEF